MQPAGLQPDYADVPTIGALLLGVDFHWLVHLLSMGKKLN